MEPTETPEMQPRDGRGRQAKLIPITVHLSVSEHSILMNLTLKKMKQTGQDVPREKVLAEALQCLNKHGVGEE